MKALRRLADNRDPDSLANRLRRKRFAFVRGLIDPLSRPVQILDLGGTEDFWRQMGFYDAREVRVSLVNLTPIRTTLPNFDSYVADARCLDHLADRSFDLVFSNSVIEHVGGLEDQRRMAHEILRVGRRYVVQTPNRWFPIEPHFLLPGFQFLPLEARACLLQLFPLGWNERFRSRADARRRAASIRLLDEKELLALFPGAHVYRERFWGFTKSLIVYGGDGWT